MNKITSFLTSPRFVSFIGHAAALAAVAGLTDLVANINVFNLPTIAVTIIGLLSAQLIGALKNYANGQPTGLQR